MQPSVWQHSGNHFTKNLLTHNCGKSFSLYFHYDGQIKTQLYTCHDSSAVMTCAKLCLDWIIIYKIRATCIFTSLGLWPHDSLVKQVTWTQHGNTPVVFLGQHDRSHIMKSSYVHFTAWHDMHISALCQSDSPQIYWQIWQLWAWRATQTGHQWSWSTVTLILSTRNFDVKNYPDIW